jgi:MYXO-CTERM domain-containing protein
VPAGRHHLILTYEPASVTVGVIGSSIAAVALITLGVLSLVRRRRPRPT